MFVQHFIEINSMIVEIFQFGSKFWNNVTTKNRNNAHFQFFKHHFKKNLFGQLLCVTQYLLAQSQLHKEHI